MPWWPISPKFSKVNHISKLKLPKYWHCIHYDIWSLLNCSNWPSTRLPEVDVLVVFLFTSAQQYNYELKTYVLCNFFNSVMSCAYFFWNAVCMEVAGLHGQLVQQPLTSCLPPLSSPYSLTLHLSVSVHWQQQQNHSSDPWGYALGQPMRPQHWYVKGARKGRCPVFIAASKEYLRRLPIILCC